MDLSIIVPCLNEEKNLNLLVDRINKTVSKNKIKAEIILVNDGSTDNSQEVMVQLSKQHSNLIVVKHDKREGIAKAWKSGLKACSGKCVLTTDADMQYLPEDIPKLYFEVLKGSDIVQGWRVEVLDGLKLRRVQSLMFSGLLNLIFSLKLKDAKSGFIIYQKNVFEDILTYKMNYIHFHQLITIAARSKNYKIKQLPVIFVKRNAGKSFLTDLPIKHIVYSIFDIVKALFEYKFKV